MHGCIDIYVIISSGLQHRVVTESQPTFRREIASIFRFEE
jgi:hypothetical protein